MLVYHPAEQGAATHEQATHEDIMARLASAQVSAAPASTPEDVMSWLNEEVRKDDVVLILTSGPMDGLVETIPSWLDSHFSQ
jgi:UDP-N-acetylmuramate: L-alanyl-gamma-D-glutamyl-meso-diaminopimelate ligase